MTIIHEAATGLDIAWTEAQPPVAVLPDGAFDPLDLSQAREVVGGYPADVMILGALRSFRQELAARRAWWRLPSMSIAAAAEEVARARLGFDTVMCHRPLLTQEMPPDIQPPQNAEAFYAFDEKITAKVRSFARRPEAAEEGTGCQPVIALDSDNILSEEAAREVAEHRALSQQAHKEELQAVAAAEMGEVPAHTPAELSIISKAIARMAMGLKGTRKAEAEAVQTLLKNGDIPVESTFRRLLWRTRQAYSSRYA